MVGNKQPLDGGIQHTGDYTEGLRAFLKNVPVVKLDTAEMVYPSYESALNRKGSTILVEIGDLYNML
jgi:hypothetical protein